MPSDSDPCTFEARLPSTLGLGNLISGITGHHANTLVVPKLCSDREVNRNEDVTLSLLFQIQYFACSGMLIRT